MNELRGPVHVVGIGGMHMSAIAQLLRERGETVRGSDLEASALTRNLEALGVTVFPEHAAANLGDARCVVATAAVGDDNPEVAEARRRGLPVLGRPEVVAALMAGKRVIAVAGSHGKTTTTSLIAFILQQAGRRPMYLIGGESRDLGGNASWGGGDVCVVEADEYQRAFHAYEPDVAVITNVDADHLDLYGTAEAYEEAFLTFARRVRAGGRLVAGGGNAGSARVAAATTNEGDGLAAETYGLGEGCTWRATNVALGADGATFTLNRAGEPLGELSIALPGEYAVENTLAAAAVCLGEGAPFATVRAAAACFQGAKRRFEHVGEAGGVTVIDEYAHHPSEVRAVLGAARALPRAQADRHPPAPHLQPHRLPVGSVAGVLGRARRARHPRNLRRPRDADGGALGGGPGAGHRAAFRLLRGHLRGGGRTGGGAGASGRRGPDDRRGERHRGGPAAAGAIVVTALDGLAAKLETAGEVRRDEPMSRHTTFGVGGPADLYVTVRDTDALARAARLAAEAGAGPFVLGSGSNVVVADGGIRGVVIDNRAREEARDGFRVRIGSGASFAGFARKMCRAGVAGLAWAVGIPGTLGGAVVYNAGAYGGCLADVLTRVRLLDPEEGDAWRSAGELNLAYRGSAFTRGALAGRTVLEAALALSDGDAEALLAEAGGYD